MVSHCDDSAVHVLSWALELSSCPSSNGASWDRTSGDSAKARVRSASSGDRKLASALNSR